MEGEVKWVTAGGERPDRGFASQIGERNLQDAMIFVCVHITNHILKIFIGKQIGKS